MPDSNEVRLVCRTPLAGWHAAHGARLVEADGWEVPRYPDVPDGAGLSLCDISAGAKLALRGRDVAPVVQAFDREGPSSQIGGVAKVVRDQGVFFCRLTADSLLLLASSPRVHLQSGEIELLHVGREWQIRGVPASLAVQDMTAAFAAMCLTGAAGDALLGRLCALDLATLGMWRCAETNVAGVHALLFRTAEPPPAICLHTACDVAEYLWELLLDAGRPFGITCCTAPGGYFPEAPIVGAVPGRAR
jgi:glycine cleavage system aminomethyltransferase T